MSRKTIGLASLAAGTGASPPPPARFLHVDARHKLVKVTLIAGYDGSNNGFNFDGYGRGELFVSVPRGWRVRVRCVNRAAMRHSCAVVKGPMTIKPAFRGATVPQPVVGLTRGQISAKMAGTEAVAKRA